MSKPENQAFSAAEQRVVYRTIYEERDIRHFSGDVVAGCGPAASREQHFFWPRTLPEMDPASAACENFKRTP